MAALKYDELDPAIRQLALRNEGAFNKQAMQKVTHTRAAARLGIAKSAQSDWCSDHLRRVCQVLAAYDLTIVDKNNPPLPPEQIRAYMTLAAAHMDETLSAQVEVTQPGELDE
jgi:hypothetical protein